MEREDSERASLFRLVLARILIGGKFERSNKGENFKLILRVGIPKSSKRTWVS